LLSQSDVEHGTINVPEHLFSWIKKGDTIVNIDMVALDYVEPITTTLEKELNTPDLKMTTNQYPVMELLENHISFMTRHHNTSDRMSICKFLIGNYETNPLSFGWLISDEVNKLNDLTAYHLIQSMLETNYNSSSAHAYASSVLALIGYDREASNHSTRALELDPHSVGNYELAFVHLRTLKDFSGAQAVIDTLASLEPTLDSTVQLHLILQTDLYLETKNYPGIISACRSALKETPDDLLILSRLLSAECALEAYQAAIKTCGKILDIDPSDRDTRMSLASCLFETGKYKKSGEVLRSLYLEDPLDQLVHEDLAELRVAQKPWRRYKQIERILRAKRQSKLNV
jgi:tetratricopeptide (TPR) repeat protein